MVLPMGLSISVIILLLLLDTLYPLNLPDKNAAFAQVVVDSKNRPLRSFADNNGVWRYPISLDQVSPYYLEALIHYEDQYFWSHPGINPASILRAAASNLWYGRIVSGGSTLSMQVARLLHPHSRSIKGKMYQALRTLQLEWHLSKREILELYCNIAPFGGTLEGIQAASFTYLNKSASDLSHAEAALLAVLPQSPTRFRPDLHPEAAQQARNKVLDRLATHHVWSDETVASAKQETVYGFHAQPDQHASLLALRLRKEMNHKSNGAIFSTIDGELQSSLEDYLKSYITRFPDHTSAAILVVENNTASVKAYLGAAEFGNTQRFGHVDMIQAIRSPGSTLKPFLYGMAMDAGLIHSQSLLADVPRSWDDYQPDNFSNGFSGPVSVTEALQRSLNLPSVDILDRLTPETFVARMKNAGIKLNIPQGKANLSIILGGVGTSLENLVTAYRALASKGKTQSLHYVRMPPSSKKVEPNQRYLLSKESAWIIQDILKGVARPGELNTLAQTASHSQFAWKTGTSYGFRDAWAIGVNQQFTVGVWIGRPDGTSVPGNVGRLSAAPLLHAIAEHLHIDTREIPKPDNVYKNTICWPLGTLKSEQALEHCRESRSAWLIKENVPPTWHILDQNSLSKNPVSFWIDDLTGKRVNQFCFYNGIEKPHGQMKKIELALWPMVLEPWLNPSEKRTTRIPPIEKSCISSVAALNHELKITSINRGDVFRSANYQTSPPSVPLQALGGEGNLHWYINGKYYGSHLNTATSSYILQQPGQYQAVVMDEFGNIDSIVFSAI